MRPNRGSKALFASQRASALPPTLRRINKYSEGLGDGTDSTRLSGEESTGGDDSTSEELRMAAEKENEGNTVDSFVRDSTKELASEYLSMVDLHGRRSQRVTPHHTTPHHTTLTCILIFRINV